MSSSDMPTKTMTFNTYELEIIWDALTEAIYGHCLKEHPINSLTKEIEHFLLTLKETERP